MKFETQRAFDIFVISLDLRVYKLKFFGWISISHCYSCDNHYLVLTLKYFSFELRNWSKFLIKLKWEKFLEIINFLKRKMFVVRAFEELRFISQILMKFNLKPFKRQLCIFDSKIQLISFILKFLIWMVTRNSDSTYFLLFQLFSCNYDIDNEHSIWSKIA